MEYYKNIYKLPYENYFRIINSGNVAYLYVFMQNNKASKLDISKPPDAIEGMQETWKDILFSFDEIEYSEDFRLEFEYMYNIVKLIVDEDKKNSKLKLRTERIAEMLKNTDNGKIDIGKMALNLEGVFDYKKEIYSKRFTMSIAEFKDLQRLANEIIKQKNGN